MQSPGPAMMFNRRNSFLQLCFVAVALALAAASAFAEEVPDAQPAQTTLSEALAAYGEVVSEVIQAEWLLAEQERSDYSAAPKISAHEHYVARGDLNIYLNLMDGLGIKQAVFVPTGMPPDNRGFRENMDKLLAYQRENPHRLWALAACDEMAEDAVTVLEQAGANGAHGFKSLAGLPDYNRAPLDGPHMRAIWQLCGRLNWPVLIHIEGDTHPHQQVEIERMLVDFPNVKVILPHYGKMIKHLDWCAQLLDRYANCYMDLSMGNPIAWYMDFIDANPQPVRDFIIKYQDRLMWGADVIVSPAWTPERLRARIITDINLLSRERFASAWSNHLRPLNGLNLPPDVLHKIWWVNPQRIYGLTVEQPQEAPK